VHPIHRLAVVSIVLLAVSSQITAFHRLVHLLYALDGRDLTKSWLRTDKGALARRVLVAFGATACDFAIFWTLVELRMAEPVAASLVGSVVGSAASWSAHRVLAAAIGAPTPVPGRFLFVACTSAILNAGFLLLCMLMPGIDAWLAWLLVRGAVFLTWNYPLHRNYVFSAPVRPPEAATQS
jgi:putative flippase GtrA